MLTNPDGITAQTRGVAPVAAQVSAEVPIDEWDLDKKCEFNSRQLMTGVADHL